MWSTSLITTLLGTELPGPGAGFLNQNLQFHQPIAVGDAITVSVRQFDDRRRERVLLSSLGFFVAFVLLLHR
jgi:phosphate acetyltransferase